MRSAALGSTTVLVHIVVADWWLAVRRDGTCGNHQPLYRRSVIYARADMERSRSTLVNGSGVPYVAPTTRRGHASVRDGCSKTHAKHLSGRVDIIVRLNEKTFRLSSSVIRKAFGGSRTLCCERLWTSSRAMPSTRPPQSGYEVSLLIRKRQPTAALMVYCFGSRYSMVLSEFLARTT